jgi:hypothetical protein
LYAQPESLLKSSLGIRPSRFTTKPLKSRGYTPANLKLALTSGRRLTAATIGRGGAAVTGA